MQNSDTFTTIPTTTSTTIRTPGTATSRRPRLLALVGGVIAVGGLTFGIGAALAQESAATVNPVFADHAAIAEWAQSNGLTGLSPASLASTPVPSWYSDSAAIADWARSNGLTGLSPASLAPVAP